ncbi:ribosome alternative rescue factor ArfA [Pseudomonas lalucatii]|uniref:Ribosome alternative rescue factor ArfA n=1 Tax=Pseudomonas lalucatii TaxID=1424203 RepID=A0ABS5Q5M8_9PSED|nr:alternative ribosome rescue factor ArfA [Pseudomonas lalucatii]MBS7664067.1 ribosome alternative rescue factor ArfA [Pseudomonas lalucatii]MBS7690847.1 ribosome alternative rescue factor ArfA [Pseudomonas lalucatii]MBS7725405.1 ribosome alternative rescue factor ArfA [Pseudomonas lalucatii]QVM86654.1 ribosome alternative rescue factor ArfA [Pseudomonas lalucatii]
MSKHQPHGPNRARSLIVLQLFRCRQEKPRKGKGSYRREASQTARAASSPAAA